MIELTSIGNYGVNTRNYTNTASDSVDNGKVHSTTHHEADVLSISPQAQQKLAVEQSYLTQGLSDQQLARIDDIHAEIDQVLGGGDIVFSKADQKSADKLYQQIDNLFADDRITAEEAAQLTKLDEKLANIYQKYERPLTDQQEQKLTDLLSELDQLHGIEQGGGAFDAMSAFYQELGLTPEQQNQAEAINKEIDQVLGVDAMAFSPTDLEQAESLYLQMDELLAKEGLSEQDEKTLNQLDEQLANIYQKYEKPLSKEEEAKLDSLFSQLDNLYGLA